MDTVLINGKEAKISYNTPKGKIWNIEKANIETLKVLDELIKFKDTSIKYENGITVINALSTIQLVGTLGITRPSNHIMILRHELPVNTVFTFRFNGEKFPKYGLAKSEKSLKAISDFRERLIKFLNIKEVD